MQLTHKTRQQLQNQGYLPAKIHELNPGDWFVRKLHADGTLVTQPHANEIRVRPGGAPQIKYFRSSREASEDFPATVDEETDLNFTQELEVVEIEEDDLDSSYIGMIVRDDTGVLDHVVLFEDAITWIKQSDHNALLHGSIEARYNNQPR